MKGIAKILKFAGILFLAVTAGSYAGWFTERKSVGAGTAGAVLAAFYIAGRKKRSAVKKIWASQVTCQ